VAKLSSFLPVQVSGRPCSQGPGFPCARLHRYDKDSVNVESKEGVRDMHAIHGHFLKQRDDERFWRGQTLI
jgi:hypothetical protein